MGLFQHTFAVVIPPQQGLHGAQRELHLSMTLAVAAVALPKCFLKEPKVALA
jgi:hypothetical protein